MGAKLKIGIVGVGWWANAIHARGVLSHPDAELAALCCRTEQKLRAAGEELGVEALCADRAPSFDDGHAAQRVMDAIEQSDRERRWIEVNP